MTAGMFGAVIGLVLGVVSWRAMHLLSERIDMADTKRLLRIVGALELVLLPAVGYAAGHLAFGAAGEGTAP